MDFALRLFVLRQYPRARQVPNLIAFEAEKS
jgi:hypothetical protein